MWLSGGGKRYVSPGLGLFGAGGVALVLCLQSRFSLGWLS